MNDGLNSGCYQDGLKIFQRLAKGKVLGSDRISEVFFGLQIKSTNWIDNRLLKIRLSCKWIKMRLSSRDLFCSQKQN